MERIEVRHDWRDVTYERTVHDMLPLETCGLCKTTLGWRAPYIPDALQSFLKLNELCVGCKTGLIEVVNKQWGLCWQDSPERFLEWAMMDWLAGPYWRNAFRYSVAGFSTEAAYYKDMGRREGWYP